jgi:hypothetical protein
MPPRKRARESYEVIEGTSISIVCFTSYDQSHPGCFFVCCKFQKRSTETRMPFFHR